MRQFVRHLSGGGSFRLLQQRLLLPLVANGHRCEVR
jgi:hypothetical protein